MNYEYAPKFNFHNASPITVRVRERIENGVTSRPSFLISKSQARRLEKHFCGVTDCRCNSAAIIEENEAGTLFSIPDLTA